MEAIHLAELHVQGDFLWFHKIDSGVSTIRGPLTSPLEFRYWRATPYSLGDGAMKFAIMPREMDPPFDPSTATDLDNVLREAVLPVWPAGRSYSIS